MSRHDLTDEQWAILEPLIPKRHPGPRPEAERRPVDPGFAQKFKTEHKIAKLRGLNQLKLRPESTFGAKPVDPQRHALRAENRLPMGGYPARIRFTGDLLAPLQRLGPEWHLGADVAGAVERAR